MFEERYYTCPSCYREFGERRRGEDHLKADGPRRDFVAPPVGRRATHRQGLCPDCAHRRDRLD